MIYAYAYIDFTKIERMGYLKGKLVFLSEG